MFLIRMYELFHLISMYNILWLNSAAIIIYYIYYTNGTVLIYEYIFMGRRSSPPVQTIGDEWLSAPVRNWNRRCWCPITNGSTHEPAVMLTHHQRFALSSPMVCEPAVMRPPITAGCRTSGGSPSHQHRHKSNAPRTAGDAHFEPAVMGALE